MGLQNVMLRRLRYLTRLNKAKTDKTNCWYKLRTTAMKAETEGFYFIFYCNARSKRSHQNLPKTYNEPNHKKVIAEYGEVVNKQSVILCLVAQP